MTAAERPTCDTPGCGRPIPIGGEGHPEICPKCLDEEHAEAVKASASKRAAKLSAAIHKEIRVSGGIHAPDASELWPWAFADRGEETAFLDGCLGFARRTTSNPFARLGAELRQLAIGNKKP